ncbi:transposase [Actinomadura sp. 6N118]|uniref:transposase n=1 Tax=Actinomadura sp. 6N118 TaxID=3375151 RepID=UPI0037B12AC6
MDEQLVQLATASSPPSAPPSPSSPNSPGYRHSPRLPSLAMPAASRGRRYPSDTSVAEWALEPLLPVPACQTKTGGHPEKWPRREIVDGIHYIVDNGAQWHVIANLR